MPTYDYVCDECGHRFERFQRMSEGNLRKCPECGRLKLKRLMGTGAGVIFKGSGFYETDYKRKSPNGTARKSSSSSSTPAKSTSSSESETKSSSTDSKRKDD